MMHTATASVIGHEQYLLNANGQKEFVVLPVGTYEHLIDMLEDTGLALAMEEAEGESVYGKDEALRLLEQHED